MKSIITKLEKAANMIKEISENDIEKSSTDYSVVEVDVDFRGNKHKSIKITFDIDIITKDKKS